MTQLRQELIELFEDVMYFNKFLSMKTSNEKLAQFRSIIKQFNTKYKTIKLDLVPSIMCYDLLLEIKNTTIQDLFKTQVQSLPGLRGLGLTAFDEYGLQNQAQVELVLQNATKELYVTFESPEAGTTGLILQSNKKGVIVKFDMKDLKQEVSPVVLLVEKVLQQTTIDTKKDIFDKTGHLGFTYLQVEDEKKEQEDRFNPYFTE